MENRLTARAERSLTSFIYIYISSDGCNSVIELCISVLPIYFFGAFYPRDVTKTAR